MPPSLALFLWFVLLVGLLWFDPAKGTRVSGALWVPLTWMFFMGSRAPSQWLGVGSAGGMAQSFEEGDPSKPRILSIAIDSEHRNSGIEVLPVWKCSLQRTMHSRPSSSCSASVLWSDFPFPSFKKWFRDLGDYSLILVVLSDRHPLEAVRTVLRRLGYLLIPLSVMLIKYFPAMAKDYDPWTGGQTFTGVSTSKNMLGIICLVCGIYFFWDTIVRWADRKNKKQKSIIRVNAALLLMIVWLLNICDSATSRACLMIACIVILAGSQQGNSTSAPNPNCRDTCHFLDIQLAVLRNGSKRNVRRCSWTNLTLRPTSNLAHRSQSAHESAPGHRLRELLAWSASPARSGRVVWGR